MNINAQISAIHQITELMELCPPTKTSLTHIRLLRDAASTLSEGNAGTMAADSEASELVQKLGLSGQEKLLNRTTDTRWPYRLMTKQEYVVFKTLFPVRTKLADFSQGIIPLRVLQVAAYCKENPAPDLSELYVWHAESVKEDPILVGHTAQDWSGQFYLLARWGDALLSFDEMIVKAKKAWTAKARGALMKIEADAKSDLEQLDSLAEELLTTGSCSSARCQYDLQGL